MRDAQGCKGIPSFSELKKVIYIFIRHLVLDLSHDIISFSESSDNLRRALNEPSSEHSDANPRVHIQ